MKSSPLAIPWLLLVLICLPGCGSTSHKTKVQDVQIQPETAHPRIKQSARTAQDVAKQKTPGIDDEDKQGEGKFVSKDLAQERQALSVPRLAGPREKQTIPKSLPAKKRGINVVAKTPKGRSQKIQLYDYTAALIIGIDRYDNLGSTEQLTYAVKDAKGVEKVLSDGFQFDEIITLYNEQATRDKIMQALYGFRSLTPDGGVFVYFAGHGITIPGTLRGKDLGYLVPYDGTLNSAEIYKNISMQQVKSDICVSITAKHVFFVFDACFAGLMLDTRGTLSKPSRDFSYLQTITDEQVRQVLTAGSKGETVLDGGPGGHSVFTGRLIQALENTEDYITARELGQYLKKRVYGDAAARGHTQRPVDGEIYGTGDFVFVPDLEKKGREISAEVDALEAEMAQLKKLKEEAAEARDQSKKREIECLQLIKEAELKQAQIRKRQKEEAAKRQRQAVLEVNRFEKDRKQSETENEQRLTMLRTQADKMRQDLSQGLTGGATIESAVAELKRIKKQRDKMDLDFSTEFRKQTQSLAGFYDKKIARITDIPPWDKEFETNEDYQTRLAKAHLKAAPARQAKEQKLSSLRHELQKTHDNQISPLDNQMKTLKAKHFIVPVSQVSFKFVRYYLKLQMMFCVLTTEGETEQFFVKIEPPKAREYKRHPELLVPEVLMKATVEGAKFDKAIFNGPGKNETYTSISFLNISDDGRFVTFAPGDEIDVKKGLKVVERDGIYVAYANGIVRDTQIGLEWKTGPGKDTTWDKARSWVQSLNLDGGGWRMPTMFELEGLYRKGTGDRNMTPLLKTTCSTVWSGENENPLYPWYFDFLNCRRYLRYRHSPYGLAFAVRSRSDSKSQKVEMANLSQKPSYSRPSSSTSDVIKRDGIYVGYANGIVKDTSTGLEWKAGPNRNTNWNEARSWVQSLNLDGGGWRMPTTDELKTLYKEGVGTRNMTLLLRTTGWWVWSGETKGSSSVRGFYFYHSGRYWKGRYESRGLRGFAVRSRSDG